MYARIVGKETDDEQVRDKHNFTSSMWKSERALDHDEVEAFGESLFNACCVDS
jgi:hypothetical protein